MLIQNYFTASSAVHFLLLPGGSDVARYTSWQSGSWEISVIKHSWCIWYLLVPFHSIRKDRTGPMLLFAPLSGPVKKIVIKFINS